MTTGDRRILVTGLVSARDVVLSLPRLAGLRAAERSAQLVVRLPAVAIDLVQRLRLADRALCRENHHPLVWLWRDWRGKYAQAVDVAAQAAERDLWANVPFKNLQDDLAFLLPREKFIVLSPSRKVPAVRMASLAKRLAVEGYGLVLVSGDVDGVWRQAFLRAAPECRDVSTRIGLPEAVTLARSCDGWLGGSDAMTLLAALSGARTVIVSEGEDAAMRILPAGRTTWLQGDDLSLLSIGDMMQAVLP